MAPSGGLFVLSLLNFHSRETFWRFLKDKYRKFTQKLDSMAFGRIFSPSEHLRISIYRTRESFFTDIFFWVKMAVGIEKSFFFALEAVAGICQQ